MFPSDLKDAAEGIFTVVVLGVVGWFGWNIYQELKEEQRAVEAVEVQYDSDVEIMVENINTNTAHKASCYDDNRIDLTFIGLSPPNTERCIELRPAIEIIRDYCSD